MLVPQLPTLIHFSSCWIHPFHSLRLWLSHVLVVVVSPRDLSVLLGCAKDWWSPSSVPHAAALGLASCCRWSPDDFNYHCVVAFLGGWELTDGTREWTTWSLKLAVMTQWGAELSVFWGLPDGVTHLTLTFALFC